MEAAGADPWGPPVRTAPTVFGRQGRTGSRLALSAVTLSDVRGFTRAVSPSHWDKAPRQVGGMKQWKRTTHHAGGRPVRVSAGPVPPKPFCWEYRCRRLPGLFSPFPSQTSSGPSVMTFGNPVTSLIDHFHGLPCWFSG